MFLRIKLWLAAAGALLIAFAATYWRGRSSVAAAAKRRELESYVGTRERMDKADVPDSTDAVRDWLRDRAKQRDL
jgi:Flp pilus assembly protein TadB